MAITSKTFNSAKYGKVTVTRQLKGGDNWFHTDTELTQDEAGTVQQQLGYHPAGYHFYDFKTDVNGTSWKCYNSCD